MGTPDQCHQELIATMGVDISPGGLGGQIAMIPKVPLYV